MKELKLNFVDFWPDFIKDNNYFFHLLNTKYNCVIDEEDPDLLFFSVDYQRTNERARYKNHRCKKIFFTGENCRPNLSGPYEATDRGYHTGRCDFAFTFDFIDEPVDGSRHYRLPLWVLQIDWFNKIGYKNPQFVLPPDQINNNKYISTPKTKFCTTVFNNPVSMRGEMYNKLSMYKPIDGYGRPFGNWFYGEDKKYEILANYKFSICFENSVAPGGGYYTEKLFHAKTGGTIPIYWTDERCSLDFNTKSFLNLNDYDDMNSLVVDIISIDNDQERYEEMFNEPLFVDGKIPEFALPESVLGFFEEKVLC
jgi:hypothetical protein